MTFPDDTNHMKNWQFTATQLHAIRDQVHTQVLDKAQALRTSSNSNKRLGGTRMAVSEAQFVVDYMSEQLLSFCQHKAIRPVVKETAACFFRRFFLKRSILEYDPRLIIFTCIALAAKVEDYSRRCYVSDLFGGMDELDTREVMRLELPVCEALDFHLLVLHCREPLLALHNAALAKVKASVGDCNVEKEKELQRLLQHEVYNKAENLCIAIQQTDLPLQYSPARIAIAAFLLYARSALHSLLHADSFVRDMLSYDERSSSTTTELFSNVIPKLHEGFKWFRESKRNGDQEKAAERVGGVLSDAERVWSLWRKGRSGKKRSKKKTKHHESPSVENFYGSSESEAVMTERMKPKRTKPASSDDRSSSMSAEPQRTCCVVDSHVKIIGTCSTTSGDDTGTPGSGGATSIRTSWEATVTSVECGGTDSATTTVSTFTATTKGS